MSEHRKKLAGNFVYLSIVQGLSILFPLITFPYLLRVLGVENFGVFTLIQTFLMYCDLLVTFGFSLTATQYVSRNLNESDKINQLISTVYLIKSFLFILSFIVCLACCIFIPYLRENIMILLVSTFYLLGNLLLPDWYFQGIQKMRNISIAAFASKVISLALIVWLVKAKNDIFYAVFAISAGNFIAGLIGIILLARYVVIKPVLPSREFLTGIFKESSYVFTSIILAPLYSSVNLFILQVFTNPLMVGYYAVSEKIFSAINQNEFPSLIYNSMIYPFIKTRISGVVWYQGESNVERAEEYEKTFPLLINSWREKFGKNLPFYFVQLATFNNDGNSNEGCPWAELRDAQTQALSLKNTGMAVTTDVGNPTDIHPRNKKPVGERLANLALKNGIYSPVLKSYTVKGDKIEVTLTGKSMLIAKDQQSLRGFEIAGKDQVFYPATASIVNNKLVVTSDKVSNPTAVRYGWKADNSELNLFTKELLPVSPFRTDNFKLKTKGVQFSLK